MPLYMLYCSRYKKSWIGSYGENVRQTEMQTVIGADVYKALRGPRLPGEHNPDLPPAITRLEEETGTNIELCLFSPKQIQVKKGGHLKKGYLTSL